MEYDLHKSLKDIATTLADMQTRLIATSFMVDDLQTNALLDKLELDKLDKIFARLELIKKLSEKVEESVG